jgi:hypothetical protein
MDTLLIDTNTTKLQCNHSFHNECYDTWAAKFNERVLCPNCRYPTKKKYLYTNPPHFVIPYPENPMDKIVSRIMLFYYIISVLIIVIYLLYIKKFIY